MEKHDGAGVALAPGDTTAVFEIFIKTTPERLWEAITDPDLRARYSFGVRVDSDWSEGSTYTSSVPGVVEIATGENLEVDPPRRLVHRWVAGYSEELAAEEPSRVTWEIEPQDDGTSLLTVVHDRLEGAPKTAVSVSGPGWMYVLSGLKTLLETGEPLA